MLYFNLTLVCAQGRCDVIFLTSQGSNRGVQLYKRQTKGLM
jgi:hypothetical protein